MIYEPETTAERVGIDDVSENALGDAAMQIDEIASHVSWTDQERAEEYRAIARFLRLKAK